MSNLTPEQEYELRNREVSVKEKEAARAIWKNPTIAAGLIAAAVAFVGHSLVSRHSAAEFELAQKKFCYTALSDHLTRHASHTSNLAGRELGIIADTLTSSDSCIEALREASDNLYAAEAKGGGSESTITPPSGTAQGDVPPRVCKLVKSIRSLGWRSGHKTNFCKARGFDGVFNPYGDYSAGGFCFQGDAELCKTEALKAM